MNWDRIRQVLCILGLLALPLIASAGAIDCPPQVPVGPPAGLAWLRDAGGHMDLPAVQSAAGRFRPVTARSVNFGFSRAAYWLRFSLDSRVSVPTTIYLSIPQPTLDDVRLYVLENGVLRQSARAGDELPQGQHSVRGSYAILPIALQPGAHYQLYLRAASRMGVLQLPLQLQTGAQVEQAARLGLLLNGVYMGVFAALLVYNLFLAISLRRPAYFYYVALLPLVYLVFTAVNGFGPWMLYPDLTWPANQGLVIFTGASFVVSLQFGRELLGTRRLPRLDAVLRAVCVFAALIVPAAPLAPSGAVYPVLLAMVFLVPLLGMVTAVICLRHDHPQARFYLLAQIAAATGTLLFGLTTAGLLHYTLIFRQGVIIGAALQAVLLALALADRIRALQRETRHAQDATRLALASRQQELERSVEERTRELEEARRHAEHLATTDVLTGVFNRRGLLHRAQQSIDRSVPSGSALSLISFDLDQFKRINDDFGHAEGDRVLCQLVQMTRQLINPQDLLGRVGGDEFLLVVGVARDRAAQIAERLRAHLQAGLRAGSERRAVTASFGVAVLSRRLSSLDTLQRGADAALYRAKRRGGNRVEAFSDEQETSRTRAIMHLVRADEGSERSS